MGFLLNAEWDKGNGLEDLVTWGVDPLERLLNTFQEYVDPEDKNKTILMLYYQMRNILMDMDATIYKFLFEVKHPGKAKILTVIDGLSDPEQSEILKFMLEKWDRLGRKVETCKEDPMNEQGGPEPCRRYSKGLMHS